MRVLPRPFTRARAGSGCARRRAETVSPLEAKNKAWRERNISEFREQDERCQIYRLRRSRCTPREASWIRSTRANSRPLCSRVATPDSPVMAPGVGRILLAVRRRRLSLIWWIIKHTAPAHPYATTCVLSRRANARTPGITLFVNAAARTSFTASSFSGCARSGRLCIRSRTSLHGFLYTSTFNFLT